MPDYSLGRAHGKIEIDYDGGGARAAAKDLDSVTASSTAADKSLTKTQKTLKDTDREFDSAGGAAQGYSTRLNDVRQASADVDEAQRRLNSTLLDGKATAEDIEDAYRHLDDAHKRHAKAIDAERDAHRALSDQMSAGQKVMSGLSNIIPNLSRNLERLSTVQDDATDKASGLAQALGVAAKAVAWLGPEGKAASAGLLLASEGIEKVSSSARSGGSAIGDFVKDLAGLELAVGKIGGLALGLPSLGGLAGLGGAAGVQGIINVVDAAKQLSGALGLLPAVVAGVGFSMSTLEVAFHGVGDALKDMMADDPKKFLEDIKDMGPVAAQAMLSIAEFRDEFKLAGAAVQDSFFTKVADDIKPLIQTWLPLVSGGMAKIAGIFGDAAHELAGLLETPAAAQAFSAFIENISAGLQAMQPAIKPLFGIFEQLTVIGSSFFEQIGGAISNTLTVMVGMLGQATADGSFQAWIQSAIDGFGHLVDAVINVSQAFGTIMTIAENFGGGGLLGWLDQMAIALNNWTQSEEGQKALTDFFSAVREATDAFLPLLGPLVSGLSSLVTAFVKLGVATAPGWQDFFNMFAQSMQELAPQIVAIGPALNQFLYNMGVALVNIVRQVGPKLPDLFNTLSNAFSTLLPQIGPLVDIFLDLAQRVGPQLPKLFEAVTAAIEALLPYVPVVVDLFRNLVSAITLGIEVFAGIVKGIRGFIEWCDKLVSAIPDAFGSIEKWFTGLIDKAPGWGQSIIRGLIQGLKEATGLGMLHDALKGIVDGIAGWFQSSPAKWGPFSGDGYTKIRGQKMVSDMADGMASAQGAVAAAARTTAETTSAALGVGGGAPAAGGADSLGGALLPPHIAGADNSVLSAYLRHQFSDTRGLKGLAKDLGAMLEAAQSGFDLVTQNLAAPMFQALGLIPGMNTKPWVKMTPEQIAAQQQNELQRDALKGKKKGPTWADVFGASSGGIGNAAGGVRKTGVNTPLGLTASSSKADIQKAIIAAGRGRGMNDAAIQTALAVAAAESGFNPTISGGIQGSAGLVSGLYQQSPSSGWGTLEQVNDPNYAINAFYDAFAKQLEKNPTDPLLAAVLTQNPQLGSGAKGSSYWKDVSAQLGLGSQILATEGKGVKGPGWAQVTGTKEPQTTGTGAPLFTAEGPEFYDRAFAHNRQFAKPSATNYQTQLSPDQEQVFRDWVAKNGVPFNPNETITDYDMRGYWQAMTAGQVEAWTKGSHFPDLFKTPYDTTFSAESQYATTDNPFKWQGDNLVDTRNGQLVFGQPAPAARAPVIPTTGLPDAHGAHTQIAQIAAIAKDKFGLQLTSGKDDHAVDKGWHPRGQAGDFSNGTANTPQMRAFAQYMADNFGSLLEELIYSDPGFADNIKSGKPAPGTSVYDAPTLAGHRNHVHIALKDEMAAAFQQAAGVAPAPGKRGGGIGGSVGAGNGLVLPSGKSLDDLLDTSDKNLSVNDQLLQAYLQGNPELAAQINAAKTPGASDDAVLSALTGIDSTITDLKTQDAVGNKNTIDALEATQNQIAKDAGFQQGQSALSTAQSIVSGASNAVSAVFQVISSGLDAMSATQDIADRLVYGVRNTEDVMKLVDDVQKYITLAANIATATGSILSTIGGLVGAGSSGDPSGGAAGASMALSSAGQIAQLIGAALQGVNMAIDFGQQLYHIAGTYVGRFLSQLTAGIGGTPLMGDVRFLLNKNTGQLITYSEDNPGNKNSLNVPTWLNQTYDYRGGQNPNPQVNTQWNIYAGPGQSPGEMLNETMWMVNTQGTTGAMAATNF
ncbi:phage tail protein [Mycobacterium aquaticum]|uniref:Tape measure protein n=1 Tax=Mycobacterium aquaticum TaxID=1927124 RepID=A0A1X0A523_9MYCO|nr:hypothetical protein [Mycobacterium aquaticum]ORA25160.1 hypothetical protein BST13_33090 [Mycobacterium aquaticum]